MEQPMNISVFFKLLYMWLISFLWMSPLSYATPVPSQKILILNAAHKGDDMSDAILDGIESILPGHTNIKLYIEYMDIKRHSINDSFVILRELYMRRYGNTQLHGIIACNDLALQFVMENRNSLFPDVPLVFCGVENLNIKDYQTAKDITGIVSTDDLEGTIDIASRLHPDYRHFVLISDQTAIGKSRIERTRSIIQTKQLSNKITDLIPETVAELVEKIKDIPEKSIVIFLHFAEDVQKNQYLPSKIINAFHFHLAAPLYTAWHFPRANGVLGGKMINGIMQGEMAANMIIDILDGKSIDTIPIITNSPNCYIFNYEEMLKFGIRLSDLPGGSMITHKPINFAYKYRNAIGILSLVFITLLGIVMILLANIIRRKKAERSLEQQIRVLNSFMETIPNPVFFKDDKLRFQQCNVAFQALIGMEDQEIIGKTFEEIAPPHLADSLFEKEQMLLQEPGFQSFETPFQRSNGEIFTVIINHATVTDNDGNTTGLIGSIQDITDIREQSG